MKALILVMAAMTLIVLGVTIEFIISSGVW